VENNSRQQIFVWTLYDWAVSAFTTTVVAGFFPIFFKDYYSGDVAATTSTARLGGANSAAALTLAFLAPVLGAIADRGHYQKQFLLFFSTAGAVLTAALALIGQGAWLIAASVYAAAALCQSASFIFYDALLPGITTRRNVDFVSALSYAAGYLGGGLVFAVNIWMYLQPDLFGLKGGIAAIRASFVVVALWWGLFALPLIVCGRSTRTDADEPRGPLAANAKAGLSEFRQTLRLAKQRKTVFLFLAAFLLYNDGVSTTIRMAVDYGLAIGFGSEHLMIAL
jgi:UMF1 family MFS transporter